MSATVTPKDDYYKIGYISPRDKVNNPPSPICYQNTCVTKNFSMCRYPNTHWQARVYYPRYERTTDSPCKCDKYLHTI